MPAGFSFYPEFVPTPAPIRGFLGFKGVFYGFAVGKCLHKYGFCFGVLHYNGDETVAFLEIEFL